MPLFSDYTLYGSPFVSSPYSPYSPVLFRSAPTSTPAYGSYGAVGYSGVSRYGPLLNTIMESGLTPSSPRRVPRTQAYVPPVKSYAYTAASSNYGRTYQRPVRMDTENIDVSTPRKPKRPEAEETTTRQRNLSKDSDTRGTIKRGRTVVRIHTKKQKDNPDVRKKMTPGERLKEKFMIRDYDAERKKREEEEERRRMAEREEADRRYRRLMCIEKPVVPQIKTVTEDIAKDADKTPENSESSGSDTETEDTVSEGKTKKKKRRKQSSVKKKGSATPVAPPRAKKAFDLVVDIPIDEPKRPTIKSKDHMKSVKGGGISKKNYSKKSIIMPPRNAVDAPSAPQRNKKQDGVKYDERKKSEPLGDMMKSFSDFFLNFGKKSNTSEAPKTAANKPAAKNSESAKAVADENKPLIAPITAAGTGQQQDSREEEPEPKRPDGRGILNKDIVSKRNSVIIRSECRASVRVARLVEKKDLNKENLTRNLVEPNETDKAQANKAAENVKAEQNSNKPPLVNQREEATKTSNTTKDQQPEQKLKILDAQKETTPIPEVKSKLAIKEIVPGKSASLPQKAEEPSITLQDKQIQNEKKTDTAKSLFAKKQIELKDEAKTGAKDNGVVKPVAEEERVDPKPLKKEESGRANVGKEDKVTAKAEQVEASECQNKESTIECKKAVTEPKVESPLAKRFPWLAKKEEPKSTSKELADSPKSSPLLAAADAKTENKASTPPADKKPVAKKEPTPPKLQKAGLKNETSPKNETPETKLPAGKVKQQDENTTCVTVTVKNEPDSAKIFLFDKESVEIITGKDKKLGAGESPVADETARNTATTENKTAESTQLQKVPLKPAKSSNDEEQKKTGKQDSPTKVDGELKCNVTSPKQLEILAKLNEKQPDSPKKIEKPKALESLNKEEKAPESPKKTITAEATEKVQIVPEAPKKKDKSPENTKQTNGLAVTAGSQPKSAEVIVKKDKSPEKLTDATPKKANNISAAALKFQKPESPKIKENSPEKIPQVTLPRPTEKKVQSPKLKPDSPKRLETKDKTPPEAEKVIEKVEITSKPLEKPAIPVPETPKKPDRAPKAPEPKKLETTPKPEQAAKKEPAKPEKPQDFSPKSSLKMLQSMANKKLDSKPEADSNILFAKDSVKQQKPLILRSRPSTVKKQPKAKLALTKPPQANFPAPVKPLFMQNAFSKLQEAFNKQQEQQFKPQVVKPVKLKKMRARTDLSADLLDSEDDEEKKKQLQKSQSSGGINRQDRHTVRNMKFRPDRVSTVRHQALKQSVKEAKKDEESPVGERKDDDDEDTSSEEDEDSDTETESTLSSGSDTETEEGQTKVDRNSTSSQDSGFGSNQNSPQASTNCECSVNCHRKCEKHMPNLCGVNQKLLAEALLSLKKAQTLDVRDANSPNPRRLSAQLSSDSESGEDGHLRRYTPPARTIPRFRKYAVEDFQFLKVLGKGSFGKVLLAELKGTECYYAVKCLKKDVVLEDDDVECTLIERKVLALGTKHPYLCHLFCTFQTESHLFFVMEYLNGGDLMFHIQQSGRFEQSRACFYAAEIVSGLRFLHKKGIVYRDLKLDNILLDFEGHVRIADFGMCKLQIYLDRTADTFCGTPDYMAPEIIKGLHYNQCVDWWSFGVLLFEMLVGQSPFNGCDEDDLFWSICNEQPYYPKYLSKEAQSILALFLEKDSSKRLGTPECHAGEVYEQPFFRPIDWSALERKELEAPFKPRVQHSLDVQYFDAAFTKEAPKLTPVDKEILNSMDQTQFHGFSYTNPNACNE